MFDKIGERNFFFERKTNYTKMWFPSLFYRSLEVEHFLFFNCIVQLTHPKRTDAHLL